MHYSLILYLVIISAIASVEYLMGSFFRFLLKKKLERWVLNTAILLIVVMVVQFYALMKFNDLGVFLLPFYALLIIAIVKFYCRSKNLELMLSNFVQIYFVSNLIAVFMVWFYILENGNFSLLGLSNFFESHVVLTIGLLVYIWIGYWTSFHHYFTLKGTAKKQSEQLDQIVEARIEEESELHELHLQKYIPTSQEEITYFESRTQELNAHYQHLFEENAAKFKELMLLHNNNS